MIRRILTTLVIVAATAGPAAAQSGGSPANPHGNADLDCASCHREAVGPGDEVGRMFDHDRTGFPLVGAHKQALCRDCHDDPAFAKVGTACADCHTDAHKGRQGPACDACHTPDDWSDRRDMRRRHDATALPLVGAHAAVDCDACHSGAVSSQYTGTPSDCYACHADTWAHTTNPPHEASGFGTDCVRCHGVFATGWSGGDFRHPSSFPLTGGHAGPACIECHQGGFSGTPTECVACHQDDYDRTTEPDHRLAQFPTDCRICHDTRTWDDTNFDHNRTAFPLTGAHVPLDCTQCHSAGYTGTPTACVACHQQEYDNTNDPNHAQAQFPTDCRICHNTTSWEGASFNHNSTAFPLTGAHVPLDCTQCHSAGYTGTPTACVACHQQDYDGTNDPNHAAANFPTQCATCHTTNAWSPSTWDHDTRFPIYSGKHRDKWNTCADCHTVPTNYAAFECIFCHEHNRTDTDRKHTDVRNYVYASSECFRCHPRGVGD
ncbi:MAG TPA: hypothetical protein PLQ13_04645 [Candidatus Krumholzibacteria bacterium]|nr:hypothetical protein [Candidatus Krumholzibacteria bacterium]